MVNYSSATMAEPTLKWQSGTSVAGGGDSATVVDICHVCLKPQPSHHRNIVISHHRTIAPSHFTFAKSRNFPAAVPIWYLFFEILQLYFQKT